MSRVFGDITQIAYVTRDFDAALKFFLKSGIGPWYVNTRRLLRGIDYRGARIDLEMSVGVANSGSLQLEIITPTSDTASIYTEWLARCPDTLAVQHVSSWPEDFAATEAVVLAAGYLPVMSGTLEAGIFGYYQHPDQPDFTFEMAELSAARRFVWTVVAGAALNWDGRDPIRPWPVMPAA